MDKTRKVMLISPDAIKGSTYIQNNVDDGMVGSAIREAQDIHLQSIIGSELMYRLQTLVLNAIEDEPDSIDDDANECYKALLDDFIAPYLEAKTEAVLVLMVAYKTRNLGLIHASDTNLNSVPMDDVLKLQQRYNGVAAKHATALSKYLCINKSCFPELSNDCGCVPFVKPQIGKTFIHTGLWLGGKGSDCCCD